MVALNLVPIFLIGLLGSVHCIGMCGGIVSALSIASRQTKPFPVAVVGGAAVITQHSIVDSALRVLAYNAGRIGSYVIAGAIAGGLVGGLRTLSNLASLQIIGYWLANLMLVALGLYVMDAWRGLTWLECAGQKIWRHVRPLMQPFLPMDNVFKALALGSLWGWLPCGMVYSVLLTAMLTGSAWSGANVMLAFGLGTLPMLLTMGMLGNRWKQWAQNRRVRMAAGLIVLLFGILGLVRAGHGLSLGWIDSFCLSPPVSVQR